MIIRTAIAHAFQDIWEDMLYLMLFNMICFVGGLVIVPLPFLLFGLFGVLYDIGQGKAIKMSHFFDHIRQTWRLAAEWALAAVVVWSFIGYSLFILVQIDSQVAIFMRVTILGMALIWAMLQLLMLALYPRLIEPSFRLALTSAAAVIGLARMMVLLWLLFIAVFSMFAIVFVPIFVFIGIALIAAITNRFVEAVVKLQLNSQS